MSWCSRRSAWSLLLVPLACARPARAQGWREAQLWGTALASRPALYGGGLGLAWRDRGRTRLGVAVAGGVTGDRRAAGRAEVAWHFLLDPTRRGGVGVYGGGGVALSVVEHDVVRPWVLVVLGLETGPGTGHSVFVEAGLGGGARVAAGLRWRSRRRARAGP